MILVSQIGTTFRSPPRTVLATSCTRQLSASRAAQPFLAVVLPAQREEYRVVALSMRRHSRPHDEKSNPDSSNFVAKSLNVWYVIAWGRETPQTIRIMHPTSQQHCCSKTPVAIYAVPLSCFPGCPLLLDQERLRHGRRGSPLLGVHFESLPPGRGAGAWREGAAPGPVARWRWATAMRDVKASLVFCWAGLFRERCPWTTDKIWGGTRSAVQGPSPRHWKERIANQRLGTIRTGPWSMARILNWGTVAFQPTKIWVLTPPSIFQLPPLAWCSFFRAGQCRRACFLRTPFGAEALPTWVELHPSLLPSPPVGSFEVLQNSPIRPVVAQATLWLWGRWLLFLRSSSDWCCEGRACSIFLVKKINSLEQPHPPGYRPCHALVMWALAVVLRSSSDWCCEGRACLTVEYLEVSVYRASPFRFC